VTVVTIELPVEQQIEDAAHKLLALVAAMPGELGRLRSGRVIGGYSLRGSDQEQLAKFEPFTGRVDDWTIKDAVAMVDAFLAGGLIAQTPGSRRALVLTRAGHRALDALSVDGGNIATALDFEREIRAMYERWTEGDESPGELSNAGSAADQCSDLYEVLCRLGLPVG